MYYDRDKLSNRLDTIEGRAIVDRIDELESDEEDENITSDELEELETLRAVAKAADGYGGWPDVTLIRSTVFVETVTASYDEQISALPEIIRSNIDWCGVAKDLEPDYAEVDFDGVAYLLPA